MLKLYLVGHIIFLLTIMSTKEPNMPKTPEQNQKIKDQKRNLILATALRLFSIRGYDLVVVNDITKEANISHGLFYHYFSNKADVFLALMKIAEERSLQKRKDEKNFINMRAIDAIRRIVTLMLIDVYLEDESPYFLYMFVNMHLQKTIPDHPDSKIRPPRETFFAFFVGLIARGQKEGDVSGGDPREFAVIYYSIIKGLCYTRINSSSKPITKASPDVIMNLFIRKGNF